MKAKGIPGSRNTAGDRDSTTSQGVKSCSFYAACPYCRCRDGHADDCLVATDIATTDDLDDSWFAVHPLATELTRPPSWGETVQLRIDLGADLVDERDLILTVSADDTVTVRRADRSEVAA